MADQEQLIDVDVVLPKLAVNSREEALLQISQKTAQHTGVDEKILLHKLMKKETQESSGIGRGVALPHLRCSNLEKPFTLLAQLKEKVDFEAVDQRPVDIVFLLLSPEQDGPYHLRRLSRITRLLMKQDFIDNLRVLEEEDAMQAALVGTAETELFAVNA